MALRTTPTIAICLVAAVATTVALARPDDPDAVADARYESAGGATDGEPVPGYGALDADLGGAPPATAAGSVGGDEPVTISIADFAFSGPTTVAPGAVIEVTNLDGATHTLTSRDDLFDTGQLGQDGSASLVVPQVPGEYAFFCEIHPSMQGTLVVG